MRATIVLLAMSVAAVCLGPASALGSKHVSVCREARPIGDFAAFGTSDRDGSEIQTRAVIHRERDGSTIAFLYLDQHAARWLQYRANANAADHRAFGSPFGTGQHRIDSSVLQRMKPAALPQGYRLQACD
jgi:hypothetical protein